MSRNNKYTFINDKFLYRNYFRERGVAWIKQYSSPIINYPTTEQMENLTLRKHIWTQGDRFYKLAIQHYGSSRHWWIIPWFNQRPLESDYKYGDVVYIPLPFEEVMALT